MSIDPRTRKPFTELSLSDLAMAPVWEFAIDEEGDPGRDESWIRPVSRDRIRRGTSSIVATDYRTARGRVLVGTSMVDRWQGRDHIGPFLILHEGAFSPIPVREEPDFVAKVDDLLAVLHVTKRDLFPVTYQLRIRFDNEWDVRSGILDGISAAERRARADDHQLRFW